MLSEAYYIILHQIQRAALCGQCGNQESIRCKHGGWLCTS